MNLAACDNSQASPGFNDADSLTAVTQHVTRTTIRQKHAVLSLGWMQRYQVLRITPKSHCSGPADPGSVSPERATVALRMIELLLKSTHLNHKGLDWSSHDRISVIVAKC